MKVGIVIGGRFPAAYRTAEGIAESGNAVAIVTSHPRSRLPRYGYPAASQFSHGWLEYFYRGTEQVPGFRRIVPAQAIKLCLLDRYARRRLGDCQVVNGWSGMALATMRAARRRGARAVLQTGSAHALVQDRLVRGELTKRGCDRPVNSPWVLRRQLAEYEEADTIVVPSSFVQRSFLAEGVPSRKIAVVPEGVDCGHLSPRPKRDDVFRVLYIGHLSHRKGVLYLLEAISGLPAGECDLVLRGDPEAGFLPQLQPFSGRYRLAPRLPAAQLADFVSQATVVVVPSIEDGWCAVTVEAMACGVPVIVSANVGTADVVREGQDGFVVPAGDAAAIAARIAWFRANPGRQPAMRRAARERAEAFTWDRYKKTMAGLLLAS